MQDLRLRLAEPRILGLAIWHGTPKITPLRGGLSNESYDVSDARGRYVVRFSRDFPFHHVFRERELMAARAAHAAGFAAEVLHAEAGLMVSRFIEGQVFVEADVRARIERIGRLVRNFHDTMPRHVTGPSQLFWPFHVIRDYARMLGSDAVAGRLPALLAVADELERVQTPLPIVFGHHDFLPGNLIDDGQKLWIIDYEYAAFSTGMFDLAGLASNASFSTEESDELLAAYFGASPSDGLRRSHAAMMCASLLREALWSLVSAIHMAETGADYTGYAATNFSRFDAAFARYRARYGGG